MKNKTLASWLAVLLGPLGLHRFYLFGLGDSLGWALPIPTALGLYGIERVQRHGVDDTLSWILLPLLGFTIAACALNAIVYGLMATERWNAKYNREFDPHSKSGQTGWLTVGAVVFALLFGATALMASIAFSFQRYFEYQTVQSHKLGR